MADQRQDRGRQAEAGDDIGRHRIEAPRQQRIAGPREGAKEGSAVADGIGAIEVDAVAPDDQEGAAQAGQRADDVIPAQPLARQQRRTDDDQQRPEVGDQPRFHGRRIAKRREVEEVITEQPGNARRSRPWPAACSSASRDGLSDQHDEARNAADGKADGGKLERRHFARRRR